MNNNYYCIKTENDAAINEVLIALLSEMPFDIFEEETNGINAYIKVADFSAEIEESLYRLASDFDFCYSKQEIASQNWNEVWESNFQPLQIGDFCSIRADFHELIKSARFEIIIQPNMAFGTGHHETTHLMIQQMQGVNFESKNVLDYGCGTGILAILAAKMGASAIIAVDNEPPAFESTSFNAVANGTPEISVILGTLSDVTAGHFDVVLANINRNVIVSSLGMLHQKLNTGGLLVISGFLGADEIQVRSELTKYGFTHQNTLQKGDWISIAAITNQ